MTEIVYTDLTQLQQAFAKLSGPQVNKVGERAGVKVAEELKDILARAPGASHRPVLWDSEKQRKAYFAGRHKDGLPLKYARVSDNWSQKSELSWATKRTAGGALLGNPATYGPSVYSHEHQTRQHKATGWTTDKEAADRVMQDGTVQRIVLGEITSMLNEVFRGLG